LARKRRSGGNGRVNGTATHNSDNVKYVELSQETRRRYLNYALSVITSRALPDIRDGLKPVQRRILYVMYHDLHLSAGAKPRKCAKICGDTTGNYHPHGEMAVYDALVRLAQDFTLREPLVDGQGNFGSVLGLPPAAARYTEARLTALADLLMEELRYQTVEMRDNYDASRQEPVVLPARLPNLLINGTSGIAVGMATNIPPHNLGEVIKACGHLIDHPDATVAQLMKYVKGPDFPLGGRIVSDRKTLRTAYEEGRGTIRVRGEWAFDVEKSRGKQVEVKTRIVIHSVPFGVSTGPLMQELGALVENRKIPQLLSVNDETDKRHGLRITLDIKSAGDVDAVMAYVFKHTSLEQNYSLNLTALAPDEQGVLVPARMSLAEMLAHFLKFRFKVVKRRFEFQLKQLERRIHILEGFAIVFSGIDKALKIIRNSDGKEDACDKLMKAFPLDREQAMAILELQLYRISKLEIDVIMAELDEKRKQADEIRTILKSDKKLWGVVKNELEEIGTKFGSKRRTTIGSEEEIEEYDPSAYIVKENTHVVVTREGWIKRVGSLKTIETTRVREGDSVLTVCPASTLESIVIFASDGVAFTLPVQEIPASTGYGEPIGKFVKLGDGVRVVNAVSTDPRFTPPDSNVRGVPTPAPHLFVATAKGLVLRLSLSLFRTPSTKSGRKYCRLTEGDRVVHAELSHDADTLFLASQKARLLHFRMKDVPVLTNAGKGVKGLSLEAGDTVLGAMLLRRPSDTLHVVNENGKTLAFGQMKYGLTGRGGKGVKTSQRTSFIEIVRPEIGITDWGVVGEG
jgi:DNA gyrase subunit A